MWVNRGDGAAGDERNDGGADAIAVGDGGETLDVASEQVRKRLGLRLTQLWILTGDMCHRAVMLTDLDTGRRRVDAGGESELAQRSGKGADLFGVAGALPVSSQNRPKPFLERGAACFGEGCHRVGTAHLLDEGECIRGESVVLGRELGPPLLGEGEGPSGPAAATSGGGSVGRAFGRRDEAVTQERVEMTTYRRRADADPARQLGSRRRSVGEEGRRHPVASCTIRPGLSNRWCRGRA